MWPSGGATACAQKRVPRRGWGPQVGREARTPKTINLGTSEEPQTPRTTDFLMLPISRSESQKDARPRMVEKSCPREIKGLNETSQQRLTGVM